MGLELIPIRIRQNDQDPDPQHWIKMELTWCLNISAMSDLSFSSCCSACKMYSTGNNYPEITTQRKIKGPIPPQFYRIRDILRRSGSLNPYTGLRIRILVFSLVAFKMPSKSNFFDFFAYYRTYCRYIYSTSVFKENQPIGSHKTVEVKFFIIFLLVNGRIRILKAQNLTDPAPEQGFYQSVNVCDCTVANDWQSAAPSHTPLSLVNPVERVMALNNRGICSGWISLYGNISRWKYINRRERFRPFYHSDPHF
jgi:hypothetical protein